MSGEARAVAIFSVVGALLVAVFSVLGSDERREPVISLPIVIGMVLVVAAATFLIVVPQALRSEGSPALLGLAFSALGLLLIWPAHWTGLPVVLGAGGTILGQLGQERTRTTAAGTGRWAVIVGVTAVVLNLVIFTLNRFT